MGIRSVIGREQTACCCMLKLDSARIVPAFRAFGELLFVQSGKAPLAAPFLVVLCARPCSCTGRTCNG
jgi:hypothetical protein